MCKRRLTRTGATRMRRPEDNIRHRLQRMRDEHWLGDEIEEDLRSRKFSPVRELGIRQTLKNVETELSRQSASAASMH